MATEEELVVQERNLQERKFGLEKYQAEFRRIWGGISYATYRINSGLGTPADIETKCSLQKELKAKTAGLKQDYQTTPRQIPRLISAYDTEIFKLSRQLDTLPHPEPSRTIPPAPDGGGESRRLAEEPSGFAIRRAVFANQPPARPQEHSHGWSRSR